MSSEFQQIERKWLKIKVFPARLQLLFAVFQSVSQKTWPQCPKENFRKSFLGPFLLKPSPSRLSSGSRGLGNVVRVQGNRAQVAQDQSFPSPPSAPFCTISVSKSEKPATLPKRKFAIVFPLPVFLKTKAITT